MKKIKNIIRASLMCIKYPFLYPRNRFTGYHYNNWKLEEILYGKRAEHKSEKGEDCVYRLKIVKEAVPGLYQKAWEDIFICLDNPDPNGDTFRSIHNIKSYKYACLYYLVSFWYAICRIAHCVPTYTEWDAMPAGWNKAFGDQYLKDIKKQMKKDKMLYSWKITDIKEKFGSLRLYCNAGSKELYDIIDKYEDLSYHTCIKCGKPATKLSSDWICPYCDDCYGNYVPYATIKDNKWVYNKDLK